MAGGSPKRTGLFHTLSIFLVMLASGLLFYLSATAGRGQTAVDADLVSLVRSRQETVAELEAERSDLAVRVGELTDTMPTALLPAETPFSPATPVSGPGVVITLTDAPPGDIPPGLTANDLVIHQQDIEDVMNALWDGGAEAMTVQGARISARTVIRCIGNVILVDGQSYSPPYQIAAIGDISAMVEAVESNARVVTYKQYVALYGLGWDLRTDDNLQFPGTTQEVTLSYAKVVE